MTNSFERHIVAAQGYVELGMFLDANAELEEIEAESHHLPVVLAVCVEVYRALEKWELMQIVAKKLTTTEPTNPQWWESRAYATRQAESNDAANEILSEAVERHPTAAVIPFALARYECILGNIEVAKARLQYAFTLDRYLRLTALDDKELEPMWNSPDFTQ